jgi:HSP20 family protein
MLIRFDPFREVDRLADEVWGGRRPRSASMPVDLYRDGDRFVALVDLPGVSPETIDITADYNVLTIKADRSETRNEGTESLVTERRSGTFSRQLRLGDGLDVEHVDASYENGVLRVTIPVAEKALPRRIQVSVGSAGANGPVSETAEVEKVA